MQANNTYPSPRSGLEGLIDRFIGPGATQAELWLQTIPSLLAAITAPLYALTTPVEWSFLQLVVIGILGLDFMGGVLTNATSAAKGWYHRPEQSWPNHLAFVSIHIFHVLVVALLFRGGDWTFFFGVSSYLLGASAIILASSLYLQRPVAMLLYVIALLGNIYWLTPTTGLEWFLPLFFLKILISHLLKETPYKPKEK